MSFLARAWHYVTRKRAKTLILFLILFVVATLAFSGLAIKEATGTAALNVRQALGGTFSLDQNTSDPSKWVTRNVGGFGSQQYYGGEPLTTKLADYIMKNVKGIKGYNATYTNYVLPKNTGGKVLDLIESDDDGLSGIMGMDDDFLSTVPALASTNTLFDSYFTGGYLELTVGRHLGAGDKNVALMSEELAKKNGISVGDKLILQMASSKASLLGVDPEKTKIEVEVIGLFKSTAKSTTMLSNWSMDNSIYTTLDVVKQTRPDMGDESYEHIHFYADDPGETQRIIKEIKALGDIDPTDFLINVDTSSVDSVLKPLQNMDRLITVLIVLILVIGAVVLYLVLAGRVKERIHESGVLLALGIGKAKIISQYLTEIVLVAVLALSLSVFAGKGISQVLGNQLLDYSLSGQTQSQKSGGASGYDGNFAMGTDDMAPKFEGKSDLTKIDVKISGQTVFWLCLACAVIISVSVVLASLPVLRLKPREILSKMT